MWHWSTNVTDRRHAISIPRFAKITVNPAAAAASSSTCTQLLTWSIAVILLGGGALITQYSCTDDVDVWKSIKLSHSCLERHTQPSLTDKLHVQRIRRRTATNRHQQLGCVLFSNLDHSRSIQAIKSRPAPRHLRKIWLSHTHLCWRAPA